MGTFYLHIGTTKTGTTAIQEFLSSNRRRLKKRGILYPELGISNRAHHLLSHLWGGSGWMDPEMIAQHQLKRNEILKQLAETIDSWKGDTLCSAEHFWGQLKNPDICNDITRHIPAEKIVLIVYLRRQDQRIQSAYNQRIRIGAAPPPPHELSAQQLINWYDLDYATRIRTILNNLPGTRMVVRPYEKTQFVGGSIFADFLHTIGLPLSSELRLPEKAVNTSLDRDRLEFLRLFNASGLKRKHQQKLKTSLLRIAAELDAPQDGAKQAFMPASLQLEIHRALESGNRWIGEKFLPDNRGQLFAESPSPTESVPFCAHQLSAESAVRILRELRPRIGRLEHQLMEHLAGTRYAGEPPAREAADQLHQLLNADS